MKRLGQTAVALVAAAGTCLGGAAAIATTTGIAPTQFLSPSPTATLHAIADLVLPGIRTASPGVNSAVLRTTGTHATTGASGAAASTANGGSGQAAVRQAKAPASHARSGASGAATAGRGSARGGNDREED